MDDTDTPATPDVKTPTEVQQGDKMVTYEGTEIVGERPLDTDSTAQSEAEPAAVGEESKTEDEAGTPTE